MLKNLLKTWSVLAPDECHLVGIDPEETAYCLGDEFCYDPEDGTDSHPLWMLQSYIQQCIETRRDWDWMLVSGDRPKTYDGKVWVDGNEFLVEGKTTAHEALLTANLTALAAQRTIARGQWQHFKGGAMEVVGVAKWAGFSHVPTEGCFYVLEECPTTIVAHGVQGSYFSYEDHCDRVFYSHNGKSWARRVDSFLGLVGPEYPESEGLLRFVEVE